MRMYVILAAVVLAVAGLLFLLYRLRSAALHRVRQREAMAARLAAALAEAEATHDARRKAAERSAALTTVLPAITKTERSPRRVALPA